MDINAAFPSKYLRAGDLLGNDITVTIAEVTIEDVGGNNDAKDSKPVLYFQGKDKSFVLNKTNARTIANLYGPETNNWIGKGITLFPTQTEFAGQAVACLRVRIQSPPVAADPAPAPVHEAISEEDIPF